MKQTLARELAESWLSGNKRKLVVWDFDLTLLKVHSYAEGVEPADVAARWKYDVADLELLRAFVEKGRELGVALGVASFGRAEVINEYLKHMAPGAFRPEDIVTPSNLNLPEVEDGMAVPNGKVMMLELLQRRHFKGSIGRSSVLFFDDDADNVDDCVRAGFTQAFHTPDGFTQGMLASLPTGTQGKRVCLVM